MAGAGDAGAKIFRERLPRARGSVADGCSARSSEGPRAIARASRTRACTSARASPTRVIRCAAARPTSSRELGYTRLQVRPDRIDLQRERHGQFCSTVNVAIRTARSVRMPTPSSIAATRRCRSRRVSSAEQLELARVGHERTRHEADEHLAAGASSPATLTICPARSPAIGSAAAAARHGSARDRGRRREGRPSSRDGGATGRRADVRTRLPAASRRRADGSARLLRGSRSRR